MRGHVVTQGHGIVARVVRGVIQLCRIKQRQAALFYNHGVHPPVIAIKHDFFQEAGITIGGANHIPKDFGDAIGQNFTKEFPHLREAGQESSLFSKKKRLPFSGIGPRAVMRSLNGSPRKGADSENTHAHLL